MKSEQIRSFTSPRIQGVEKGVDSVVVRQQGSETWFRFEFGRRFGLVGYTRSFALNPAKVVNKKKIQILSLIIFPS